ncbi:MAG: ABC transporter permease, partial [Planctomycetota bacterium]|jgi:ABC-type transport system involved in multi-copper enzyme maturation permease subunit
MPSLVDAASQRGFAIPRFVAEFLATVLPVLENFNIYTAISTGTPLGAWQWLTYLGWALLYCLLYSSVALFVALLLFEDRDLA